MKKLVFTIQIFSLMALVPAYMIAELNHERPVNNSSLKFTPRAEEINIHPSLKTKGEKIAFINASGFITKKTGKK